MAKGINANDLNDTLANNIDNIIFSTSNLLVPKVYNFYYKCDEF